MNKIRRKILGTLVKYLSQHNPSKDAGLSYFGITFECPLLTFQKQPPEVFCRKKVFLKISQNSQENTCATVSFLIKLQA